MFFYRFLKPKNLKIRGPKMKKIKNKKMDGFWKEIKKFLKQSVLFFTKSDGKI
jgi:lipid II:glycine glycyltransferase (peptidoglycan interpeptide bridge formation enzyme)